jgi:ATP-binding cassette subfamily F protein 3
MLDPDKSVIEEVYQIVPHESVSFVRGVCGSFLFSGEDVDKPIKVLSGGEKARVSLAKILIKPGNLLVMDEPTNHLDLISSEILIDALADFNGSLLFVSHNQSFINRLATKIWDIRDSKIIEYPGGLYEYYDHLTKLEKDLSDLASKEAEEGMNQEDKAQDKTRDSKKEIRKKKAENRNLISSKLKPVLDKLSLLENKISDLERREKEISGMLTDPDLFKDKNRSIPLLNEYSSLREEMEKAMFEWEKDQGRLEEMEEELGLSDQS